MSVALENEVETGAPPESRQFPQPDRFGSVASISKNGFHRVAYVEWGDPASEKVAFCVHGLSRQGRDFDLLAAHLAARGWRVICPDLVGRGQSDWLRDPEEYNLPQYAVDMTVLIARLAVSNVTWIGTSLGGLIGMVLAGQADTPVSKLVVNDIGPFISWQSLHRLASSVRSSPATFSSFDAAVAFYRQQLAPFGNLSDDEWAHLARYNLAVLPDGTCRKYADPEITAAFKPGWYFNLSLWSTWDSIRCPVYALRGADSDLLSTSIAQEMSRRGPKAVVVDIPGCGHAPALMDDDQIELITGWLE